MYSLLLLLTTAVADWLSAGNRQFAEHQFPQAQRSYQKEIAEHPQSHEAWRALGLADLELQDYQGAYQAWIRADSLDDHDPKCKYLLDRLFYEADLPNEAARWLRASLTLNPHDPAAETYLGLSAEALGFEDTAQGLYRNAIYDSNQQKKPYSWAYLALAKAQLQSDHDEEARKTLAEGAARCPEAHLLATYGDLLAKLGDTAQAEIMLRRSIGLDPSLSQPHYRLALLLKSQGETTESQAELQRFQAAKRDESERAKVIAIRR